MSTVEPKSAFHELGLPDADELQVKADLLRFLAAEIRGRGLSQKAVGELLDLDQPNVSALIHEKFSRFSIQKLMVLIAKLGFAVSIHVEGRDVSLDVPYRPAA
jgi:predicted XRE-type DNA-binding protein